MRGVVAMAGSLRAAVKYAGKRIRCATEKLHEIAGRFALMQISSAFPRRRKAILQLSTARYFSDAQSREFVAYFD
jgi:hypothetical protein